MIISTRWKLVVIFTCIASLLTACAKSSKDITEIYVSPLQYNGYDCDQLAAEAQRLRVRMTQIGGRLDQSSTNDKFIAASSVFLYGIPLIFVGGNKDQEAEFSRLKGEASAVEEAAIRKRCSSSSATLDGGDALKKVQN